MESSLTSIYVADGIGAILTAIILAGNVWRVQDRKSESLSLVILLVLVLLNCMVDPCVFTCDRLSGSFSFFVNYVGNCWLFISMAACSFLWLFFLAKHVCGGLGKLHLRILIGALLAGGLGLIVNCFYPFIFLISDENVYNRLWGYWIYAVLDYGMGIDSLILYYISRKRNGMLNVFPVWVYFIPLSLGVFAQTMVYGVSLISASLAVSMAGVFASLQNELIFRDHLTGLFNRVYLDYRLMALKKVKKFSITGIMIDLNSFKKINDNFGHSTGDAALVNLATILQNSVADRGAAVRYAGDEFVVLLESEEQKDVDEFLQILDSNLQKFNSTSGESYKLSVSYGVSKLNLQDGSSDDFIKTMDHNMYENKREYYAKNDRRSLRT